MAVTVTPPTDNRDALENPWTWRTIATILGITAGFMLLAQHWSGLDTPDSSFYASLALFGDEVTDRAPFTSYYWTRLGYIAPVRGITLLAGPWLGFMLYKAFLILLLSGATFLLLRRHLRWIWTTWLTIAIVASSVMLSYLGNTYLTGTVLAGAAVLIALGTSPRAASAAVAGVFLGWMVMTNPVGALLGGTLWLTLTIHSAQLRGLPIQTRLADLGVATVTTIATFLGFLGIGTAIFPKMDWFGAYRDAQEITLSNFASTSLVWLEDISLLVPASILILTTATWIRYRDQIAAQQAFIISLTSIAFMLVFNPLMGGIALEAPLYQSMLWPPALLAFGLAVSVRLRASNAMDEELSPLQWGIALLILVLVIAAGFAAPGIPFTLGIGIALVLTLLWLFSPNVTLSVILTTATFLAGAQLLQNSRGDLGLYYLSPYSWAYASNPISEKIHTAVNSQEWLLANTTKDDQILLWVDGPWTQGDRELYVAAGMQLWGENRITLEPTLTDEYGIDKLDQVRPDVLALYGKSMDSVMTFWNSIPKANDPTAPICYDYVWPADPSSDFPTTQGHTCLTRLSWSN